MARYLLLLAASSIFTTPVAAQTIIGAQSAVINAGGPGSGSIADTYNQNGLSTNYVSGVTNFNAYIAGGPRHTDTFSGFEWFSALGTTTATVTYDLGSVISIDRLALWNEESSGIGLLNLLYSTNGAAFTSLGNFTPTDNPVGSSYLADVFSFGPTSARYVRLDMSRCPQPNGTYNACAIGEVAFRTAAVAGGVPEPATWAMLIVGFGGVGASLRRRRSGAAVHFA